MGSKMAGANGYVLCHRRTGGDGLPLSGELPGVSRPNARTLRDEGDHESRKLEEAPTDFEEFLARVTRPLLPHSSA